MPTERELWKFYRPPGYPTINHEFLFQSADESNADNENGSYEDEDEGQGWGGGGEGGGNKDVHVETATTTEFLHAAKSGLLTERRN